MKKNTANTLGLEPGNKDELRNLGKIMTELRALGFDFNPKFTIEGPFEKMPRVRQEDMAYKLRTCN